MSHLDSSKGREDGLRERLLSHQFALPSSAWGDMQGRLEEAALLANDDYLRTTTTAQEFALPASAWEGMQRLLDQQPISSSADSESEQQTAADAALRARLQNATLALPASAWADMQKQLNAEQQAAADAELRARLQNSIFALPASAWADMQNQLGAEQQAAADAELSARLQTTAFATPATAWDDMQSRLQAADAQQEKRKRRFFAFGFFALAALCLFSTLWYTLPSDSQKETPKTPNDNTAAYEAPVVVAQQQNSSTAQQSTAANLSNNTQNASLFSNSTQQSSLRSSAPLRGTNKTASLLRNTNSREGSLLPSNSQGNKLRLPLLLPASQLAPSMPLAANSEDKSSSPTSSDNSNNSSPQIADNSENVDNNSSSNNANSLCVLPALEPQLHTSDAIAEVSPATQTDPISLGTENDNHSPVQVNLAFGLSQKLMATSMKSSTTLVLGAGITYQPSARHKFIVGAQFKQVLTDGGVFAPSTTPSILSENPAREVYNGSLLVDNSYKAKIHHLKRVSMVEIPILYQYQVNRKHGIQAGVKLAAITHIETRQETPFAEPLSASQIDKNDVGIEQFSLSALIGYEYKINRNCALELQYSLGFVNMMYSAQQKHKPYTSFWGQDAKEGNIMLLLADSPTEGAILVEAPERLFNSDLQLSLKYSF